jgi:hypothetical protein
VFGCWVAGAVSLNCNQVFMRMNAKWHSELDSGLRLYPGAKGVFNHAHLGDQIR